MVFGGLTTLPISDFYPAKKSGLSTINNFKEQERSRSKN